MSPRSTVTVSPPHTVLDDQPRVIVVETRAGFQLADASGTHCHEFGPIVVVYRQRPGVFSQRRAVSLAAQILTKRKAT